MDVSGDVRIASSGDCSSILTIQLPQPPIFLKVRWRYSNTVVFDQMTFARQVGLLPPDGSGADKALKAAFNAKTRVALAARRRLGTSTTAPS